MKKTAKWISISLLVCLVTLAILWAYHRTRYQAITGKWADPIVEYCDVYHSTNSDQSVSIIHYFYTVSQTAKLKYPYYVWADTDWEKRIEERHHSIALGYGVSIIKDGKSIPF